MKWNAECLVHETAPLDCVELPGVESWLEPGEVLVFFRGLPMLEGLTANDNRKAFALTYDAWVLQRIERGKLLERPVTTEQLLKPPRHVDEALTLGTMEIRLGHMRRDGKIVCTNGFWSRREPVK